MKNIVIVVIGITILTVCQPDQKLDSKSRRIKPNILLVVADDMGWTDLGCFGSEIETPNIDKLARSGFTFTDFHTSVSCSPTRSMLLSGTDNHIAGLGTMGELITPDQRGKPGYEGHLNNRVVSLAEVLRDNGYHTYMTGKWHLGSKPDQYPSARGFERSFSMLNGGASYWNDMIGLLAEKEEFVEYVIDDEIQKELPKDFYATREYTDFLMASIRENREDGKPFLAYLAYTSPHDPMHVPEPWQSKYDGKYDDGYEELKSRRTAAAKAKGIVPKNAKAPDRFHMIKEWNTLNDERKAVETKAMEVYAGMVNNMDYHYGRIVAFLKDIGEYENTIVIFMSDNGPNPWFSEDYPGNRGSEWFAQFDNSAENIGNAGSHYAYGMGWGAASAGPLDLYKMTVGEGGIRTPLLIKVPGLSGDKKVASLSYVWDIMPTILDFAGIDHPDQYRDKPVQPMRGKSLKEVLSGKANSIYGSDEYICGEMGGTGKWARQGDYKAAAVGKPYGDGTWHLYNLATDPGEVQDLSEKQPDKLKQLVDAWNNYAEEVGVVQIDD